MSTAVVGSPSIPAAETFGGRFYRPELDALRFFAFFGVFVFHAAPRTMGFYDAAGIPHWLGNILISTFGAGAYGVDLFFALSAYLITSLMLRERAATGGLDLRSFYLRRILRIWPLYLSFVAFAALAPLWMPDQRLPLHYVAGFSLLAGNWMYVLYGLPASFAIPVWTVSIEEQFYLTWPIVFRRASLRRMVAVAAGMLVIANVWRITLATTGAAMQAMEYNTFTRLDPIALGILIALIGNELPKFKRWQRIALLSAGLVSWIATYAFSVSSHPDNANPWRLAVGHPLTALASVAILLSVLGSQHRFLKNRQLLYLGKVSYGLYVVHEFGHFCASRLIHAATPLAVLAQSGVSLAFTVLLAAASYRWLESPFLKLKQRFSYVQSRPV
jgi:peptidoglycan/LPS O-acetylase OafA/YrhL